MFVSTAQIRAGVPIPYGVALVAAPLVSLAYALLTAQIFLWVLAVVATVSFGVTLFVAYLFYRLVVAVERIADDS